jgi:hypothetical protein
MHGVQSPTRHLILDPRGGELLFQIIALTLDSHASLA